MTAEHPERGTTRDEIEALRERVARLEERVDATETTRQEDRFDGPVLDRLEEGQLVTTKLLTTLYKQHTDIKQDPTVRTRIEALTDRDMFELKRPGCWEYLGADDE